MAQISSDPNAAARPQPSTRISSATVPNLASVPSLQPSSNPKTSTSQAQGPKNKNENGNNLGVSTSFDEQPKRNSVAFHEAMADIHQDINRGNLYATIIERKLDDVTDKIKEFCEALGLQWDDDMMLGEPLQKDTDVSQSSDEKESGNQAVDSYGETHKAGEMRQHIEGHLEVDREQERERHRLTEEIEREKKRMEEELAGLDEMMESMSVGMTG